uniref:Uncharacterized protein n=1 Tax=Myotis myotis TaxID=51298 RepID=A0A7J7R1C9_MYOMY|nr:hypothetical protein mMyoMyo1_011223 [Myotis myotis]
MGPLSRHGHVSRSRNWHRALGPERKPESCPLAPAGLGSSVRPERGAGSVDTPSVRPGRGTDGPRCWVQRPARWPPFPRLSRQKLPDLQPHLWTACRPVGGMAERWRRPMATWPPGQAAATLPSHCVLTPYTEKGGGSRREPPGFPASTCPLLWGVLPAPLCP